MKKQPDNSGIIAEGRENILASDAYKKQAEAISTRIYEETHYDWSLTPWWKKPYLKWKIEKRFKRELEKLAPTRGLYLRAK